MAAEAVDFQNRVAAARETINAWLDARLPAAETAPASLHAAMRYAVLNGGKRVRAFLVIAAGEATAAPAARLERAACAVEFIHAYSLVHDDLPSMDDDALRRGLPTCHIAFDEPTALLAGDALQTLAFEMLAMQTDVDAERALEMVRTLGHASGSLGMAGGQAIDLAAVGRALTLEELETMHRHKTGALIRASVRLGALCAPAPAPATLDALDTYAACIGLAFQIQDDILDVVADTQTLGKTQGADVALNKPTYPGLLGLEGAKDKARALHERAVAALADFGPEADTLRALSGYIVERVN